MSLPPAAVDAVDTVRRTASGAPRALNVVFLSAAVILLALHTTIFFAGMLHAPIGYDEGYILQAPLNLVHGHGYSTEDWLHGGPRIPFDALLSTGPVVGMPVALSMLLFGSNIVAARIVMLPFYLLLVAGLFILGRRVGGRWAGLAAVAAVLAFNPRAQWPETVIMGPSTVVGEYPAAALIVLGLVLLRRHPVPAALALGLAIMAKTVAGFAIPVVIIAIILSGRRLWPGVSKPAMRRRGWLMAAAAVAPMVVWQLVKLVSLGPGGFVPSALDQLRFIFHSGSGIDGAAQPPLSAKVDAFLGSWYLPAGVAAAVIVAVCLLAAAGIRRYWVTRNDVTPADLADRRFLTATSRVPVEVWCGLGLLSSILIWWLFISSSIYVRHMAPELLASVPILVALAARGARWLVAERPRRARVLSAAAASAAIAGIAVVACFQGGLSLVQSTHAEEWTLSDQRAVAGFIDSLGVDNVQGVDWWANPDIRFLSRVPSTPLGTGSGPLVLGPLLETLSPSEYKAEDDVCADTLYDENGYIVCAVDPQVAS